MTLSSFVLAARLEEVEERLALFRRVRDEIRAYLVADILERVP